MRHQHPAWSLLVADHAPLIASFLQRSFVEPNLRVMAQTALERALKRRPGVTLASASAKNGGCLRAAQFPA